MSEAELVAVGAAIPGAAGAPDGRDPHRAVWLWHFGPAPCPRTSLHADRWATIIMAAHAELLLARTLASDLRRP
ncbi:MAG TPA: hypothetical protein VF060_33940 [Trebonia sp.]